MVSPRVEPGNIIAVLSQVPTLDKYRLNTQLASAIVYLHRDANVGDLKGDNVLYSEDGCIKLADLGLAIVESQTWILSQTNPGGGTLRWMSSVPASPSASPKVSQRLETKNSRL
ncbi:Tyrosine kinase domain protein [Ceratobasidium sp. AG-Ba]|nr:Tyrosine kinase domain protein [Ceratobasidium sp. AG-Ba]